MTAVTPRVVTSPVVNTTPKEDVEAPFWRHFLERANVSCSSAVILPLCKSLAIATLSLYILNQKHLLPKHLSQVVSKVVKIFSKFAFLLEYQDLHASTKVLFWPTLPITISKRLGKWVTRVDDTVLIGKSRRFLRLSLAHCPNSSCATETAKVEFHTLVIRESSRGKMYAAW